VGGPVIKPRTSERIAIIPGRASALSLNVRARESVPQLSALFMVPAGDARFHPRHFPGPFFFANPFSLARLGFGAENLVQANRRRLWWRNPMLLSKRHVSLA